MDCIIFSSVFKTKIFVVPCEKFRIVNPKAAPGCERIPEAYDAMRGGLMEFGILFLVFRARFIRQLL